MTGDLILTIRGRIKLENLHLTKHKNNERQTSHCKILTQRPLVKQHGRMANGGERKN